MEENASARAFYILLIANRLLAFKSSVDEVRNVAQHYIRIYECNVIIYDVMNDI